MRQKYYFHILNDTTDYTDEDGTECASLEAALDHARAALGQIICDEMKQRQSAIHLSMMIDDAEGIRVANMRTSTSVVASLNPFVSDDDKPEG